MRQTIDHFHKLVKQFGDVGWAFVRADRPHGLARAKLTVNVPPHHFYLPINFICYIIDAATS